MHNQVRYGNRAVQRKQQSQNLEKHYQSLRKTRPITGHYLDRQQANITINNRKKQMSIENRFSQIQRQNRLLLQKITNIMNKGSNIDGVKANGRASKNRTGCRGRIGSSQAMRSGSYGLISQTFQPKKVIAGEGASDQSFHRTNNSSSNSQMNMTALNSNLTSTPNHTHLNRTLHGAYRKRQMASIQQENFKMLKRLKQKKSEYGVSTYNRDWKKKKCLIEKMSLYPFVLNDNIAQESQQKQMTGFRSQQQQRQQSKRFAFSAIGEKRGIGSAASCGGRIRNHGRRQSQDMNQDQGSQLRDQHNMNQQHKQFVLHNNSNRHRLNKNKNEQQSYGNSFAYPAPVPPSSKSRSTKQLQLQSNYNSTTNGNVQPLQPTSHPSSVLQPYDEQIRKIKKIDGCLFMVTIRIDQQNMFIIGDHKQQKNIKVIQLPIKQAQLFVSEECNGNIQRVFEMLRYDRDTGDMYLVGEEQDQEEEEDAGKLDKDNYQNQQQKSKISRPLSYHHGKKSERTRNKQQPNCTGEQQNCEYEYDRNGDIAPKQPTVRVDNEIQQNNSQVQNQEQEQAKQEKKQVKKGNLSGLRQPPVKKGTQNWVKLKQQSQENSSKQQEIQKQQEVEFPEQQTLKQEKQQVCVYLKDGKGWI